MAKKSKKKTVASTRKKTAVEMENEAAPPQGRKKLLKKIFEKKEKKPLLAKLFKGKEKPPRPPEEPKQISDANQVIADAFGTSEEEIREEKVPREKAAPAKIREARLKRKRLLIPHRRKQQIKGGVLVLIGLFALVFIGYSLFIKFFRPQSLAELLPQEETLAFAEINVDAADSQVVQFYELLKRYPVYQPDNIIRLVNFLAPVTYSSDLEPWLGRRIGIALLNLPATHEVPISTASGASSSVSEHNHILPVFFIESRDHNKALEVLKSQAISQHKDELVTGTRNGVNVYSYKFSHSLSFAFLNNYLVCAENEKVLDNVIDSFTSRSAKLTQGQNFQKVSNNLPHGGLVFAYVDLNKYFDAVAADPSFIAQKGRYFSALKPYLGLFNAEGLSVFAEKDKFVAQTFTAIKSTDQQQDAYITFNEKYKGDLLSFINETPVLFAGGQDLTKELNRLEAIFKSGAKSTSLVFNGLLESQKQKYLGKNVDLQDDIYPLLKGEYLLAVDGSFQKPDLVLLLTMMDKKTDEPKLEKLINEFIKTSGIFSTHTQSVTLPDGTVGQELVSSPEQISRSDEDNSGINLTTLTLGQTGWNIYVAAARDKIIITTNKDTAGKIIGRINGQLKTGFSTSDQYFKDIKPLLRTADELFSFKLGALTSVLGLSDNDLLKPYLLPFMDVTLSKNYFTDGISTIYFVRVI